MHGISAANECQFISQILQKLRDIDILCWRKDIEKMNKHKLRTYKLSKENLICENYVNKINIVPYRKALTKLRGGNKIYGRILVDMKILRTKISRGCKICNDSVEDEYHFLLE